MKVNQILIRNYRIKIGLPSGLTLYRNLESQKVFIHFLISCVKQKENGLPFTKTLSLTKISLGEDYEKYQEFYKRKTKLTTEDFLRLKKIIDQCDVDMLTEELDNNVTVQCCK